MASTSTPLPGPGHDVARLFLSPIDSPSSMLSSGGRGQTSEAQDQGSREHRFPTRHIKRYCG